MCGGFLKNQTIDIIIPVFNEGEGIIKTLLALKRDINFNFRLLICYDFAEDTTIPAISDCKDLQSLNINYVLNPQRGPHSAVLAGFKASNSPYVIVFPADDDYNTGILNKMSMLASAGADIVCASRFMPGGLMVDCPILKSALVRTAAKTLYVIGRLPTHDGTNGFRLFSRRVIEEIKIESTKGFTYSLELIAKCHRLGWIIMETPARWYERSTGTSRFKVLGWVPAYLRWYSYVFATTWLRIGGETVPLNKK